MQKANKSTGKYINGEMTSKQTRRGDLRPVLEYAVLKSSAELAKNKSASKINLLFRRFVVFMSPFKLSVSSSIIYYCIIAK